MIDIVPLLVRLALRYSLEAWLERCYVTKKSALFAKARLIKLMSPAGHAGNKREFPGRPVQEMTFNGIELR